MSETTKATETASKTGQTRQRRPFNERTLQAGKVIQAVVNMGGDPKLLEKNYLALNLPRVRKPAEPRKNEIEAYNLYMTKGDDLAFERLCGYTGNQINTAIARVAKFLRKNEKQAA